MGIEMSKRCDTKNVSHLFFGRVFIWVIQGYAGASPR